ncbi:MAG TPA: hypothetical protein VG095_08985, partial [Chthoniobacterales bacterium]|nr:hypothetical protein [Chthoniobacterales bacterium]
LSGASITSLGGIDFTGVNGGAGLGAGDRGGELTISANSLTIGPGGIAGPVSFNGGSGTTDFVAGGGGTFTVNAPGTINVNSDIEATTGVRPQNAAPSGTGGTVTLNSTNETVTVNSRIQVSSNDAPTATPSPPPRRRTAVGGNINITSGKAGISTRAVAINVTSSSQLLSLLAAAPTPRPGGKVTILATGANSDINLNGRVQVDGGTVDVRHQAAGGRINIQQPSLRPSGTVAPPQLAADVIKAGAFGSNGQLNIGNSTLSADTLIRLYAPSSNGQLNFIANVTLQSPNIALAAGTVTVASGVVVTIASQNPANVYTNNPNYSTRNGGNNANGGIFQGPGPLEGVNSPQPLANAPPFDSPPAGVSRAGGGGGQ